MHKARAQAQVGELVSIAVSFNLFLSLHPELAV